VFLTNAALCMKEHGCQGPVQTSWFRTCGETFLRPQVELVSPLVVIALGQRAFNGLLWAYGRNGPSRYRDAVEAPGFELPNGSTLFAVYHCGRRILNTHRNEEQQFEDWRRVAAVLEQE